MTNDHLDDEAISAYLDGEATTTEAAHVEGCGACGARLESLRVAAAAIGTPPPPPGDARREAAVAAAVRAASAPGTVVPLRRRRPPQWLAAAAAVLVVVALIPVLSRFGGGSDDRDMTAAGDDAATEEQLESSADDAAGSGPTSLSAPAVPIDGGNVGEVTDRDVRRLVEEAVSAPPSAAAARDSQQDERAPDDADAAFGSGGGSGAAPVDGQGDTAPAPCEDRARSDFEDLSALRYRAIGTVKGKEVSILAFDLIADEPRLRVLALSLEDCTISLSQEIAVEP